MPERRRVFVDLHGSLLIPQGSGGMPARFYTKLLASGDKERLAKIPTGLGFEQGLTGIMTPGLVPTFPGWLQEVRKGDWQQAILDSLPGPRGPIVTEGLCERLSLGTREQVSLWGKKTAEEIEDYRRNALDIFEINQPMVSALQELTGADIAQATVCSNLSYLMAPKLRAKLGEAWNLFDPQMRALLRTIDAGPSPLLKVAAGTLRSKTEKLYFIEDDMYMALLLEQFGLVYVPLDVEQAWMQPELQQQALREILAKKDRRVKFQSEVSIDDLHQLVSL